MDGDVVLTITMRLDLRQQTDLHEFAAAQGATLSQYVASVIDPLLPGTVVDAQCKESEPTSEEVQS